MKCPFISTFKIGEGCDYTFCQHNIFWDKLNLSSKAHPNETSLLFSNCMCLLQGREFNLEEIGGMWGITRERIRQIERDGVIKLLSISKGNFFLEELGFKKESVKKRLESLKAKKFKTGK